MSALLSQARAHFERMSNQSITVPEWGDAAGNPAVIHFAPLTLRDRQKLRQRAGDSESKLTLLTVMCHAKDPDGALLFADSIETIKSLETAVDPAVLARIAVRMLGASSADDLGN